MRTSGRGADHVDLDHLDWVEDAPPTYTLGRRPPQRGAPPRRRQGSRRRTGAPASAARPSGAPQRAPRPAAAGGERAASQPARADGPPGRRSRRRPSLGPGVAERRTLTLVTFLLVVYGLVMAYSASAAQAYFQYGSSFYFFGRQALWVCLGVGAMYVLSRVDYAWFRRAAVPLAGLALAGLCLVLVPGVGSVDQRRPALDHRGRAGGAAERVRQARLRRARGDAHRQAAARGPDARGVPAARRHLHPPGGRAHHARAGPRHHARPGDRRRGRPGRRRGAPALPVRAGRGGRAPPCSRSSPWSRTGSSAWSPSSTRGRTRRAAASRRRSR